MMSVPVVVLLLALNPALGSVTSDYEADSSSNYVTAASSTQPYLGPVDILRALNVTHGTPGVRVVAGAAPGVAAYRLRPAYARVQLPSPASVTQVLRAPGGFTLVFVYRQQRKSLGTLLSVHSPGKVSPWLQLTSNQRTGQLLLHYRLRGDVRLHSASWPLWSSPQQHRRRAGAGWTHVALSVVPVRGRLLLRLDCQSPLEQKMAASGSLDVPRDALVYFRQEPGFKKKFLGTMQVAKVLPYSDDSGAAVVVSDAWNCDGADRPSVVAV